MARHTIKLVQASAYDATSYGIVFKSETRHPFAGKGVHNPHHDHVLQVWMNSVRRDGRLVDPKGKDTTESLSFLWSPNVVTITAHPGLRNQTPEGATLQIGDEVELVTKYGEDWSAKSYGVFVIEARPLDNPHMVRKVEATV